MLDFNTNTIQERLSVSRQRLFVWLLYLADVVSLWNGLHEPKHKNLSFLTMYAIKYSRAFFICNTSTA